METYGDFMQANLQSVDRVEKLPAGWHPVNVNTQLSVQQQLKDRTGIDFPTLERDLGVNFSIVTNPSGQIVVAFGPADLPESAADAAAVATIVATNKAPEAIRAVVELVDAVQEQFNESEVVTTGFSLGSYYSAIAAIANGTKSINFEGL